MNLKAKNVLVTGGSMGLGLELAKGFLKSGANVVICARDRQQLGRAHQELKTLLASGQQLEAIPCDVASVDSVAELFKEIKSRLGDLDVLVCNAGVYGPKGPLHETDFKEWTRAVEINLNGVVLCCQSALPSMIKHKSGKIIVLSGGGATKPMPYFSAYAASKAAVVRFAETLAGEVAEFGIDVNCIAPGLLATRYVDEVIAAGPEKVGKAFYDQNVKAKKEGGMSMDKAVGLSLFLASAESNGITGKLISAMWDPWSDFPSKKSDLQKQEIYTLRRILPKERGCEWG